MIFISFAVPRFNKALHCKMAYPQLPGAAADKWYLKRIRKPTQFIRQFFWAKTKSENTTSGSVAMQKLPPKGYTNDCSSIEQTFFTTMSIFGKIESCRSRPWLKNSSRLFWRTMSLIIKNHQYSQPFGVSVPIRILTKLMFLKLKNI